MSIAEQFAGLDMENLIGGPLAAAAGASSMLAGTTAEFIRQVGFDQEGKVITAPFGYQQRTMNDDGTSNLEELKVDVPMLSIVPIPNLQIDEVNVIFDMEVRQSETTKSSTDMSASMSGSVGFLFVKAKFSGSVSSHKENTRQTDNSAKYHVDVRATNHGTPEGLARVLDMMAANVSPALVGSTLKDSNGQSLSEKARAKAERQKQLRNEISELTSRLNAAKSTYENSITQFKRLADVQQNTYRAMIARLQNGLNMENAEEQKKAEAHESNFEQVDNSWNVLQSQTKELIQLVVDSGETDAAAAFKLFGVKAFSGSDPSGDSTVGEYTESEAQYSALNVARQNAVAANKDMRDIEKQLHDKNQEYNSALSGMNAPAAIPAEESDNK